MKVKRRRGETSRAASQQQNMDVKNKFVMGFVVLEITSRQTSRGDYQQAQTMTLSY